MISNNGAVTSFVCLCNEHGEKGVHVMGNESNGIMIEKRVGGGKTGNFGGRVGEELGTFIKSKVRMIEYI